MFLKFQAFCPIVQECAMVLKAKVVKTPSRIAEVDFVDPSQFLFITLSMEALSLFLNTV